MKKNNDCDALKSEFGQCDVVTGGGVVANELCKERILPFILIQQHTNKTFVN